tara:strand:- start:1084 stop:1827 length:744 start_codon:yes stop_codon:yes gene_type:complete
LNFFSLFKRKILYKIKKKINIDRDEVSKKTLDQLFYYYGSDKADIFRHTQEKGHGYSNFYSQNLESFKKKELKILEIGSYSGASAAAFKKYLPNSSIYCFDINISKFDYASKNIHVYGLDINNENELKKILRKITKENELNYFDLIIDDGSHYLKDILFSLKTLFRYLKNEGIYIIEDFKYPNYYDYNRDVDDILVDEMLACLKEKKFFKSNIIKKTDQIYLFDNINKINCYKGNLKDSDICFLKKR